MSAGTESLMDDPKRPPETIAIRFCPACGRDDRFQPFTGKSHFAMYGIRCPGTPVRAEYRYEGNLD